MTGSGHRIRVSRVFSLTPDGQPPWGSDPEPCCPSPRSVYLGNAVGGLKPKHLILGTLELPLQPLLLLFTDPAMMLELFQLTTQVLTLGGKWKWG